MKHHTAHWSILRYRGGVYEASHSTLEHSQVEVVCMKQVLEYVTRPGSRLTVLDCGLLKLLIVGC